MALIEWDDIAVTGAGLLGNKVGLGAAARFGLGGAKYGLIGSVVASVGASVVSNVLTGRDMSLSDLGGAGLVGASAAGGGLAGKLIGSRVEKAALGKAMERGLSTILPRNKSLDQELSERVIGVLAKRYPAKGQAHGIANSVGVVHHLTKPPQSEPPLIERGLPVTSIGNG